MTQPEAGRATLVCNTCKTRKKGCDKSLPTCGYCSKRSLPCCYTSIRPTLITGPNGSAKHAWDSQALARTRNSSLCLESSNILEAASLQPTPLSIDLFYASDSTTFCEALSSYVSYVLKFFNMQVAALCHSFFNGIHQWLPIISPGRFMNRTIQSSEDVLNAEDSVLLLAIRLVIMRPSLDTSIKSPKGLDNHYLTVKSCFAKAQAIFPTTLPLVQAGILIATYEYASRRPETAYISIETCVTMANLLGLNRTQLQEGGDRPDHKSRMKSSEQRNVWWGIIVMERQVQVSLHE